MIPKLVKQLFATYVLLAAASAMVCWAAQVSYFASGVIFVAVTGLTQAWVAEVFGRRQPTRLGGVFAVAGLVRMLFAAGGLLLPLSLREGVNMNVEILQFSALYGLALLAETWLIAVRMKNL